MAIHHASRGSFNRPNPVTSQASSLPSPTGGMDARANLAKEDTSLAIYLYNLIPAEYGLEIRSGYQRHQTNIVDTVSLGVRTVIPYTGVIEDGNDDRIFSVTNEGIFDTTAPQATPLLKLGFAMTTGDAGYGMFTHYDTDAGDAIIFYADAVNGLFQYDPDTDAWTQSSGITGVTIENVNFVTVHKQRIWLGVENSSTGYYLAVGAIAGAAEPFHFGNNFPNGGDLVALVRWTLDGGIGLDDYLVAVSRGGDVTPWQGDDPTAANWNLVGAFYIGETPKGNRIFTDFGGDVLLLSEFGITAMSDLLRSSSAVDPSERSIAFKIATLIRADMSTLRELNGWSLTYLASQGLLIVTVPPREGYPYKQYCLSRTTRGWCYWNDVPMDCISQWRGVPYFGTEASTLEVMNTDVDGRDIEDETKGLAINISMLTNYTSLGAAGMHKQVKLLRPNFLSASPVTYRVKAVYDYAIQSSATVPDALQLGNGRWDNSDWDSGTWVDSTLIPQYDTRGGNDIGRAVSIFLVGTGYSETRLISVDITWTQGGFL